MSAQLSPFSAFLKRSVDIIVSATAIFIFLPIFIIAPLLIKLESPGPVFFRQKRFGQNNEMFGCLKFRSMYL